MENQKLRRLAHCSILLPALLCFAMTLGCQQNQDKSSDLPQTNQALVQKNQTLAREVQRLEQENQGLMEKARELEKEIDTLKKTVQAPKLASVERKARGGQQGAARVTTRAATTRSLYHQVKRGETLYQIGKAYGISYQDLARVNKIRNPSEIRVGQKIFIPAETRK